MNPSLLIIPDRYKAAKLYSQLPESGDGDFTVVRSTTATRVNASGLIESVASGVPRIDYTGGGCGKLLVEPAATNLLLYSEEFDDAYWSKTGATVIANAVIAPDGTTTADNIVFSAAGQNLNVLALTSYVVVLGDTLTISLYAKTSAQVINFGGATSIAGVNVYSFEDVGDGYFRQKVTRTFTAAGTGNVQIIIPNSNFGVGTVAAWGAQLETGSVATSYIPTVAATVTRNADNISLSSASGLIGQTEGTLYAEFFYDADLSIGRQIFSVFQGVNNEIRIFINTSNQLISQYRTSTSQGNNILLNTLTAGESYKIALAYQDNTTNGQRIFVNGTSVAVSNTTTMTNILTSVFIGSRGNGSSYLLGRFVAGALYTSALSDPELIALTTL